MRLKFYTIHIYVEDELGVLSEIVKVFHKKK